LYELFNFRSLIKVGKPPSFAGETHIGFTETTVTRTFSIPPKYSVSNVVGYLKGKSAISIDRKFKGRQKNFTGEHFWARGYVVLTVGLDDTMVIEYIRNQEKADKQRDQFRLGI